MVEDNSFLRVGERGFVLANIIGFGSYSNVKLENDASKSNTSMKITCLGLIYQNKYRITYLEEVIYLRVMEMIKGLLLKNTFSKSFHQRLFLIPLSYFWYFIFVSINLLSIKECQPFVCTKNKHSALFNENNSLNFTFDTKTF